MGTKMWKPWSHMGGSIVMGDMAYLDGIYMDLYGLYGLFIWDYMDSMGCIVWVV